MFPGVYGFTWDAGNLIFLGLFFTVVAVIATTVTIATLRTRRDMRLGKEEAIRWSEDFHTLPLALRACRHELTGELRHRSCPNGFDCRACEVHGRFVQAEGSRGNEELYHRGHTRVRKDSDGNYLIALTEFGRKVFGTPEAISLPAPGSRVRVNGKAWMMRRNGQEVRILSPLDGVVIAQGTAGDDWCLKLAPIDGSIAHLLNEKEADAWRTRELERLQILLGGKASPALADGGELVDDLPAQYPEANWDDVWGQVFLEG